MGLTTSRFSSIIETWGSVRTRSLKALALFVCLLFVPAAPAVSGGQAEVNMSDVQRLMKQLDYPAALKLLAKIQREHPERRDETQRLIMQIISNQGKEYNQVLGELIHVLYEQQDSEKALPLIITLQKLDPNRSAGEAKRSLLYVSFLKLMDSAAGLLSQGKPAEALDLYLLPLTDPAKAGFDMDKSSFNAAGYGDIMTASVRETVARITDTAALARGEMQPLREAQSELSSFVTSATGNQSPDRLDAILSPLAQARQQERTVLAAVSTLDDVTKAVAHSPQGAAGEPYLRYVASLCQGRKGKPPEGIAQAMAMMWEPGADTAADSAATAAASAYSAARRLFDQGDLSAADPRLQEAYDRGVLAVKAISFAAGTLNPAADWGFSPDDAARLQTLLGKISQSQEVAAEASSLRTLISLQREAQALPSLSTQDPQVLLSARAQAQALQDTSAQASKEWLARAADLTRQSETGPALGAQIEAAGAMATRFDSFTEELSRRDLDYAVPLARLEAGQFETRLSEEGKLRIQGQDKLNGTVNGRQPGQDVFVQRKPAEALSVFDQASTDLSKIQADMETYRGKWSSDRSYVASSASVAALLTSLDATGSKIQTEASELSRLTQLAEQQHEQALTKRKEADLAFSDGSRAFTAKQYDGAKLQLGDARDLYLDSLLLEEDPGVRKRYTVEIPALIDRINNAIVEQYIAEVDVQVSAGRKLFANGEFLKAFLLLETAQGRWKATLGDRPNTDLDSLLEKVRNALRVSGGRDLAPDDSRAPAVNGFLNLANEKVARADKMQKSDPRRKQLLDDAYGNVTSALDVAPVYRTAKALQLRIRKLQAKDDAAFRAEARSEIDEIISEYHNKKGQPERLYFALKDYQDLLPDYQPLKDAVQELEISLGFRIRPPSATDISRSNDALTQAQTLYDPANPLTFDPALGDLDTAIRLNPSNALAIALRRTILLKEGSPEASAISSAGLARFAESKRLYNTEDYASAYKILQGLMTADKRNASYPPLAQLYLLTQQKLGLR